MDYSHTYNLLIEKFRLERPNGYSERHHIIPECVGGGNEHINLVDLPPRYHFVAHLLLHKIHPDSFGLLKAVVMMSGHKKYTSKTYAKLRIEYAKARAIDWSGKNNPMLGVDCSGQKNGFFGKKHTDEYRKKRSESMSGKNNPNYGKQFFGKDNPNYGNRYTEEHKARMSAARIGKRVGEENHFYGQHHTEETRAKMSQSQKGKHIGQNNIMYGRRHSPETIQKMSMKRKEYYLKKRLAREKVA